MSQMSRTLADGIRFSVICSSLTPAGLRRPLLLAFLAAILATSGTAGVRLAYPEGYKTPVRLPALLPAGSEAGSPSAADVYQIVSPSVALVATTSALGSGVLIRDGYIITNFHVVWPHSSAYVVFPDEAVFRDVPVVGWDPMADIAVLGPITVDARPLTPIDGEDTPRGSELYLVGYPAEAEELPDPTITRGILSNLREWEPLGMTYLQTDAAIAGGQSGGALVNSKGEVIGISTFSYSEAGFGLAASVADVMPIVLKLIRGEPVSELGNRRLLGGDGSFRASLSLVNPWDQRIFAVYAREGDSLEIEITGPGNGQVQILDLFGPLLAIEQSSPAAERGVVEPRWSGVHFLTVRMNSGMHSSLGISSNFRLFPLNDPDDGMSVAVGETVAGSLDHPQDADWYSVRLEAGERVRVSTDSINVNTMLIIDPLLSSGRDVFTDDDSGGGMFGMNAEIVYRAPHSGEFLVGVTGADKARIGGYYLSIAAEGGQAAVGLPNPQPRELSSAEVYERVSPAVPFVLTDSAAGSGVLIPGGYVITNYHVVWPHNSVYLVFPDRTVLRDVPVAGWDPMADLAVLGPVNSNARPLRLADGESLPLGTELFLIGYPAETETLPTPTITRGILSNRREWQRLGMTYLQTDAAIAGGQSGGALVNARGEVVGISTFSYSEAGFGLAASAADIQPVVMGLIQGKDTSGLGERRLPYGSGEFRFSMNLLNSWHEQMFVLYAKEGTTMNVGIEGLGDGFFRVSNPFGSLLEVDEFLSGVERGSVTSLWSGIHFLQVGMNSEQPSDFIVASNIQLLPVFDPDDGRRVALGTTVAGSLDHFDDWDWFSIQLKAGEIVRVSTDSINVDTTLFIDFAQAMASEVVFDDDSGGGMFDMNAEIVYQAPHTGEYRIIVTGFDDGFNVGGYYLTVEPHDRGISHLPIGVQTDRPTVETPLGKMMLLEDPLGRFSMQIPADWMETDAFDYPDALFSFADPSMVAGIVVNVEDLHSWGVLTLSGYADVYERVIARMGSEGTVRDTARTFQGLPVEFIVAPMPESVLIQVMLLIDSSKALSIAYFFEPKASSEAVELVAHLIATFNLTSGVLPLPD